MYGKFFASAFTGSMMGAGPTVFAVWSYIIANTCGSQVEVNVKLLSMMLGTTEEDVQAAVDYLCSADPKSRSAAEDGRRLLYLSGFSYKVVNHEHYLRIKNEDDRREYNRRKKEESHARLGNDAASTVVNDCQHVMSNMSNNVKDVKQCQTMSTMSTMSAQEEEEAEAEEKESKTRASRHSESFKPKTKSQAIEMPEGVDEVHWNDWTAARKAKRLPAANASIWAGIVREAEKAGITPAKAVQFSAENAFAGFKAEWYQKQTLGAVPVPSRYKVLSPSEVRR